MKLGIGRTHLNIKRDRYIKPIANIILNGEKLKQFPLKLGVSTLSTLIQHNLGISSDSNKTEEIKEIKIGREEVKLCLFSDHMILYQKDLENSIKKNS
jgi:hypothetical protein